MLHSDIKASYLASCTNLKWKNAVCKLYKYSIIASYMLATYEWLQVYVTGDPIMATIPTRRIFLHTQIIKFKLPLVIRRIVLWKYYVHITVCVAFYFTYMCCTLHVWFDATHVLCLPFVCAHMCSIRVTHVYVTRTYCLSCGWFVLYVAVCWLCNN